jgi:hypothetical protein
LFSNGLYGRLEHAETPKWMKGAPDRKEDVFEFLTQAADTNDVFAAGAEQFYFSRKVKNLTEKSLSCPWQRNGGDRRHGHDISIQRRREAGEHQ